MAERVSSPPTRRVIAVLDLLAHADRALGASEIASRLGIARATATAILAELLALAWVSRDDERAYALGPAAYALGTRAPSPDPSVLDELAVLARTCGCGVTMSEIEPDSFTVLAKQQGGERDIPGIPVGQRFPLAYPAGASVMPWREPAERAAWQATVSHVTGQEVDALLELARRREVVVFRPTSDDAELVNLLADLLATIGRDIADTALRDRSLRELGRLTACAYTADELDGDTPLPISYLAAPVVERGEKVRYEIQIGPLLPTASRADREAYITALRATARRVAELRGRSEDSSSMDAGWSRNPPAG